MENYCNEFGQVIVGDRDELFLKVLSEILNIGSSDKKNTVGLTGGSTPKAFYKWMDSRSEKSDPVLKQVCWAASDERFVPLSDSESNFGNADRMFLTPIDIASENKVPWPIGNDPVSTADSFNEMWNQNFGANKCFDLCFLGMGDDCHTASIFPGSPLVNSKIDSNFTSIEVAGKGWRLTITASGLNRCKKIVVLVMGLGKADAIKNVFEGTYDPEKKPIQILKNINCNILWCLDRDVASKLSLKNSA